MPDDPTYRQPAVSGDYPAIGSDAGLETGDPRKDVFVVVTQAYDGAGNNLIHDDNPQFDGFPGVGLWVELPDGRAGQVTLSPIHGDSRRTSELDVPDGVVCKVYGSKGGPELDRVKDVSCSCPERGYYYRLYLSDRLAEGAVCLICNVWGCHRSRIVDDTELLSWIEY